jgi:hypothetical protein
MIGQILKRATQATHSSGPAGSATAAEATPPGAGAGKPKHDGVENSHSSYKPAAPPNPYSPSTGRTGRGGAKLSPSGLATKVRTGQVRPEHFKGMDPQAAAQTLEQLATGGKAQLANLGKLMASPDFSETLGPALGLMKPQARQQILSATGDAKGTPIGAHMASTLERALEASNPTQRHAILRDALLDKSDLPAIAAVNGYIGASPERVTNLLLHLGTQLGGAQLGAALGQLSDKAMMALISGIGNLPEDEAQGHFRKLGEAVAGPPKSYKLRDKLAKAIETNPIAGGYLLGQVARDRLSNINVAGTPGAGRKLAKDILGSMGPEQLDAFMKSLAFVKGAEDVKKLLPAEVKPAEVKFD